MILKEKVGVITGGARGIGREIAVIFMKEGAQTIVLDIAGELQKEEKAAFQKEAGGVPDYYQCDVSDFETVTQVIDKILDKYSRIDILINNAGITRDALILKMTSDDWHKVISVNVTGVFNCIKAVTRPMMRQRGGSIVNMSSIIGLMGNAGQANYAASKAGIIGLTKSAAKELASRNIRINAVAPGFIQTEMTARLPDEVQQAMLGTIPMRKFGTPSDVARLVLFLASDASEYITGEVIRVDGGMAM
ncbi:MAG: 3-oxoacyl-[acyl-carrier-protein] reductase [Candidatus Omnitrophica bacterium]|nr:3-oxoacyl-[acyl-carrier-protein] reductase [Candidatus Omnitrophota bacterium]